MRYDGVQTTTGPNAATKAMQRQRAHHAARQVQKCGHVHTHAANLLVVAPRPAAGLHAGSCQEGGADLGVGGTALAGGGG